MVGAAEGRGRRPGGRDQFGHRQAGSEDLLLQRGDVPLDRVVEIDINRFDADLSGEVVLDARWRIYKGDNETLLASGRSMITEQGPPVPGYDGIVAAMSQAVGGASQEIAQAIAGPPQPPARRARKTS